MKKITNEQIETLYARAGMAGDIAMAAICKRALDLLDLPLSRGWTSALTSREQARVTSMSVLQARLECAATISAAEAMG